MWRQRYQRFHFQNVTHHDCYWGGTIVIGGVISMQAKNDLHIYQNGTVTGVKYQDEMLQPIVRPYAGASATTSCSWTIMPDFRVQMG